jgi:5'-3' exonuclease|tara:strand:- start:7553 stop:8542 length:990 start_codon:yes stop_codon:yes gene_type:complete
MTHIIVDTANTFFRARHVINGSADIKLGMAFHITLNSIKKAWQDFDGTHVIFCLEGRSWRKDYYEPYKRNRSDARAAHNEQQQEEEKIFWEAFDTFKDFVTDKTNCTVMQHKQLEADDLIAGWVQAHPDVDHVIISTDTDFQQLVAPNCKLYNGVQEVTTTHKGFFDKKGKFVIDNKTKLPKAIPDPQWLLFEKCMRGDTSDNVFSAYPGVRKKGTKNKVGLTEAFEDKTTKGYNWNNLMLQRWVDHNGAEHRVLDDYERNRVLIDLSMQPSNIRTIINDVIEEAMVANKDVSQVGIRLMKFCHLYDLKRITDQAQAYAEPLNARYNTV